eukprot:m51a1_g8583 putative chromatin regulator subfamily b member 1 (290) ;mRNA; f:33094-34586
MADNSVGVGEMDTEEDILVPIRLELSHGDYKLSDFFTWNLNEKCVTPEQFARQTCADLDLPTTFEPAIAQSMRRQLAEFRRAAPHAPEQPDQIEWDASSTAASPEAFASRTARDIGLPQDFVPAIATTIREQLLQHTQAVAAGQPTPLSTPKRSGKLVRELFELQGWGPAVQCSSAVQNVAAAAAAAAAAGPAAPLLAAERARILLQQAGQYGGTVTMPYVRGVPGQTKHAPYTPRGTGHVLLPSAAQLNLAMPMTTNSHRPYALRLPASILQSAAALSTVIPPPPPPK